MAIEYTWSIVTCEHEVATGGITVAHWRLAAVDDALAVAFGHVEPRIGIAVEL